MKSIDEKALIMKELVQKILERAIWPWSTMERHLSKQINTTRLYKNKSWKIATLFLLCTHSDEAFAERGRNSSALPMQLVDAYVRLKNGFNAHLWRHYMITGIKSQCAQITAYTTPYSLASEIETKNIRDVFYCRKMN